MFIKPLFIEIPLCGQPELHYINCIGLPLIFSLYGISAWQITFAGICDMCMQGEETDCDGLFHISQS